MTTYIGFRIEVASRIIGNKPSGIIKKYNAKEDAQIFDLFTDGKITVERKDTMLMARGASNRAKRKKTTSNFAIMVPIDADEINRVIQIVNVLGNGRLIRERVKTFVDGSSTLNHIPELNGMGKALQNLDKMAPGVIVSSWYYAPEAKYEDDE